MKPQALPASPSPEKTRFQHAVKWAYVMTLGQRGIAFVLTFVLAAILGPRDFGLVTIAMAFIIVVDMLVAQGMGAAIIQRDDLTPDHINSAFWMILLVAAVLATFSVFISPLWAAVNHLPELTAVIRVLAISIPIKALAVIPRALLQRKMDFRSLALISGSSAVTAGVVGVSMALAGCGVWSLVAQQLVDCLTATVCVWMVNRWRPFLRFSVSHLRDLLGFSCGMFASQLGVYVASQADVIIMGIFFGPIAVGLYRLANRAMTVLLEVTSRSVQIVALPHFSRLQDNPAQLRHAVLSCIRLSATITIPAMAVLAVTADEWMAVLGSKWQASAPVISILVVLGSTKAITLFVAPLLLSKGKSQLVAALIWTIGFVTVGGIALLGPLLSQAAVERQIAAIALARTAIFLAIHGSVTVVVLTRMCRIDFRRLIAATGPGLAAAMAVIASPILFSHFVDHAGLPPVVTLLSVAGPACAAGLITLLAADQAVRRAANDLLGRLPNGRSRRPDPRASNEPQPEAHPGLQT